MKLFLISLKSMIIENITKNSDNKKKPQHLGADVAV